jgi:hypothetical protein
MQELYIDSDVAHRDLITTLGNRKRPFTVIINDGRHRTLEQNRLQRMWCNELSPQLALLPEEVRGLIKLTIGVPLMREQSETFREKYDRILKPLSYEQKIELMMEPIDLPVTRIMNVTQKTEYLNRVFKHFSEMGMTLTQPEERAA